MEFQAFLTDVGVAFGLGVLIGVEREMRHHDAGLRTTTLVCLGAALFVCLARLMVPGNASPLVAQVVSGVGFLAGGVIIREGFVVRGLNTAGTIWCAAAIGALAGAGFLIESTVGAAAVLALHILMRPLSGRFDEWIKAFAKPEAEYRMRAVCNVEVEGAVRTDLLTTIQSGRGFEVRGLQGHASDHPAHRMIVAEIHARNADDNFIESVVAGILAHDGVVGGGWDRLDSR
jgi:putative Mg2+ transporter-C (MgtC) family protein